MENESPPSWLFGMAFVFLNPIVLIIAAVVIAKMICKRRLRVEPGQLGVIWNGDASTAVERYYAPGLHWHGKLGEGLLALRFSVDRPVLVYSGVAEARTAENERIWLAASLTLAIAEKPDTLRRWYSGA
jgi:hypothetical protein